MRRAKHKATSGKSKAANNNKYAFFPSKMRKYAYNTPATKNKENVKIGRKFIIRPTPLFNRIACISSSIGLLIQILIDRIRKTVDDVFKIAAEHTTRRADVSTATENACETELREWRYAGRPKKPAVDTEDEEEENTKKGGPDGAVLRVAELGASYVNLASKNYEKGHITYAGYLNTIGISKNSHERLRKKGVIE